MLKKIYLINRIEMQYNLLKRIQNKLYFTASDVADILGITIPFEIKAGKTPSDGYFKDISYWNKLSKDKPSNSFVIFGGNILQKCFQGNIMSWDRINALI